MLGRHGAAEGKDVPQRRLYDFFRGAEFFRVPRDEILVRMAVASVSIHDRLLKSMIVGDRSCNCDRLPKFTIGNRPVSTHFPPASIAKGGASLVHRRGNAVA